MKIAEAVKKVVYGEGVNPTPTKVVSVLFALMVSIINCFVFYWYVSHSN